jgi:hypothetical protein
LNGGQKKGDEHADDGNDDQELDESECEAAKWPFLRIYPPPPQLSRLPKLTFAEFIVFSLLEKCGSVTMVILT